MTSANHSSGNLWLLLFSYLFLLSFRYISHLSLLSRYKDTLHVLPPLHAEILCCSTKRSIFSFLFWFCSLFPFLDFSSVSSSISRGWICYMTWCLSLSLPSSPSLEATTNLFLFLLWVFSLAISFYSYLEWVTFILVYRVLLFSSLPMPVSLLYLLVSQYVCLLHLWIDLSPTMQQARVSILFFLLWSS